MDKPVVVVTHRVPEGWEPASSAASGVAAGS